jgi:hypothetical protein
VLVDAGKRYAERVIVLEIAAADYGDVLGYSQALIHGFIDRSYG